MKKKLISFGIILAMLLSVMSWSVPVSADSNFSGSGTEQDPYLIGTASDLTTLASLTNAAATASEYADKYYKLTADIDMTGISYKPISYATSMYTAQGARFTGTLDGDGHIIKNITINTNLATYGATAGIIGVLGTGGAVKNLGVENMTVTTGNGNRLCIGGIAGSLMANMSIDRCYVRGMTVNGAAITGSGYILFAGGLVGTTVGNAGTITNSYSTNLSFTSAAATKNFGGLMGACGNAGYSAANSYTTLARVEAWDNLQKTNCYTSSTIADATAANLGAAYKENTGLSNSGYPLLAWEEIQNYEGAGTAANPYLIQNASDLTTLATLTNTAASAANYADKYYRLTADIDMTGVSYKPISYATSMYTAQGARFTGTLDGDGHIIKNITINTNLATYGATAGIIGVLGTGGAVKNLGVENMTVTTGNGNRLCIGGIAGSLMANMSIDRCYVRGMTVNGAAITGSGYILFAGGLVGTTVGNAGTITNSYSTNLSFTSAAATKNFGGLMGACGNAGYSAANSYTTLARVEAWDNLQKTNCYTSSTIANATAANLGAAFKKNTGISNNGYALLAWEEIQSYEGAGTAANPYLIHNANELLILSNLSNSSDADMKVFASKHYRLTADIDMAGISYMPISWGTSMYTAQGAAFTGSLDGDGHIIKNISIPASYAQNYGATAGLIGILGEGGFVKDLGVENMTISTGSGTYMCIGGIAASLMADVSIDRCYVRGMTVNGAMAVSPVYVGGIAGRTFGYFGMITDCYTTELSFTTTNDANHAAGIVGSCGDSGYSAVNSYTTHAKTQGWTAETDTYLSEDNCYTSGTIVKATAANLGLSYIKDADTINGGHPILVWEYEALNPGAQKTTVTVNKTGSGDIYFTSASVSGGSVSAYPGQGLAFTLTPASGSVLTAVNYGGKTLSADGDGKYAFEVEQNGTLNVTFQTPTAGDTTVYVSTNGNDANDGTLAHPFKTVQAAVLASRSVTGNKTINIANGEYSAENAILLGDSDDNIEFCAYEGGSVVISGGKSIDKSLFSEYEGNANILVADLSAAGVSNFGKIKALGYGQYANIADAGYNPVVAIDGEYQTFARYPNTGYLSANSIVTGSTNAENLSFTTSDVDASRWAGETNLGVFGFFANDWADASASATVSGDGTIALKTPSQYGANTASTRFYVFNAFSELDTAGECYIDFAEGKLYIYKPANWASVSEITFAAGDNNLLDLNGATNVTIDGITFENTNANGIKAQNAAGLSVTNSTFKNVGRDAMYITASTGVTIRNNTIRNIGVTGIRYINSGARDTLTSCNTVISNNSISNIGQVRKAGSYGIDITNTVGVLISDNVLHDMPHGAIIYDTCNDAVIEYNKIYNTNTDVFDSGAIYSGRNWTTRGNEIRYNYIHDIGASLSSDVQAVYLDDGHSSTNVHHNVFARVPNVILIGGGRDNVLRSNLIIDSNYFFRVDERFTREQYSSIYDTLVSRYDAVPYSSAAWSKYPHISNILEDQPKKAKYNNLEYNVRYNTTDTFSHPLDSFLTNGSNNVNNNPTVDNTGFFLNYADGEFAPSGSANSISATAYNYIKDIPFERMGFAVGGIKVNGFDLTEVESTLTASVNVKNYDASGTAVTVYIAQYNGNQLIAVEKKRITVGANATVTDTLSAQKQSGATSVKAFLWDDNNMPLYDYQQ